MAIPILHFKLNNQIRNYEIKSNYSDYLVTEFTKTIFRVEFSNKLIQFCQLHTDKRGVVRDTKEYLGGRNSQAFRERDNQMRAARLAGHQPDSFL